VTGTPMPPRTEVETGEAVLFDAQRGDRIGRQATAKRLLLEWLQG
jgi:hypothetical protein